MVGFPFYKLFLTVFTISSSYRGPPKKVLKFRNYAPKDEKLKEKKVEKTKPIDGKNVTLSQRKKFFIRYFELL